MEGGVAGGCGTSGRWRSGSGFRLQSGATEAAPELALRRTGLVDHFTRETVMAKREMHRLVRLPWKNAGVAGGGLGVAEKTNPLPSYPWSHCMRISGQTKVLAIYILVQVSNSATRIGQTYPPLHGVDELVVDFLSFGLL